MPKIYSSDLTDFEWQVIAPLIPKAKKGGRKRSTDQRAVLNAIFYILKTGCQWHMLPKEYPPKSTVYMYFAKWRDEGTIEKIHRKLRKISRVLANKKPNETVGIIDSQSVKTTEEADSCGYDGGKKNQRQKTTLNRRYSGTGN